ncbi:ComEC/Rec2 family competence protein [Patescibacteria group bacterium]
MSKIIFAFLVIFVLFRLDNVCQRSLKNCVIMSQDRGDSSYKWVEDVHKYSQEVVNSLLPSPHSELLLGMTIGANYFSFLPTFNDMLRETGTIHVVVVSGFNISLVYTLIFRIFGQPYKIKNLLPAVICTLGYAVISGFDPPVIRAWIMGSIFTLGKYYGRKIPVQAVLVFSALVMLVINPLYLFSLSFQLSFLATLGLVLFANPVQSFLEKRLEAKGVLIEDLSATLAAQVLVWPLISYSFGTISLISPLVNFLILWTVPLTTILGGVLIMVGAIPIINEAVGLLAYMPLEYFTTVVEFFSKVPHASIGITIGLKFLIIYYFFVFMLVKCRK